MPGFSSASLAAGSLGGQSSGWEADRAMCIAAALGQPLPRLGPLLSPTEAERSAVFSSLLSSEEASRCRPSAPGT